MECTIHLETERRGATVRSCSRSLGSHPEPRTRRFGSLEPARHSALLCVLGMACALVIGCDKSEESSAQSRSCERFCDFLEKCDDGTDLLDCTQHCESDEVRSTAYFRARADCGNELSCNQWMTEVDSQGDDLCSGEDCNLNECVDHALREEKLSEEQDHACRVISSMFSACDPSLAAADVADECERIAPALSDDYLEDSETCVLSECSKIAACLNDLAERHGTDLKVYTGAFAPR
jgi:hypothetical protein